MSWSVNDIYILVKYLTRKNQSGGISATDLFYAWNTEQSSYHQDIVGRWQARANGKSGINTGLILNEADLTELSPFIIEGDLTISGGEADKPTDLIYRLAVRVNGVRATYIKHGQIAEVTTSVIDPPSVLDDCYYFMEYENYYTFLPSTVTSAEIDYVAECTDIKWGYTYDSSGRPVYNAGTSVQPKWNKNTIITITKRALTNLGVSYKDADFTNFGRIAQTTGD